MLGEWLGGVTQSASGGCHGNATPQMEKQCRLLLLRFPVGQESDLFLEGQGKPPFRGSQALCCAQLRNVPV